MKRLLKQYRFFVRGFFVISLLLFGMSILTLTNTNFSISSHDFQVSFSLRRHDPIRILCNSDFGPEGYNFPGTGTVEEPYLIAGYNITITTSSGISISHTTKYFIVRDCYVNTNYSGIIFNNVADGTATVFNNICDNNYVGIYIENSDSCIVTYNLLEENEIYGVFLDPDSDNNTIHNNNFVDNNLGGFIGGFSQACDHGTTNVWYDTETFEGNVWSDWSGVGSYVIDGLAGASDLYPLNEFLNPPTVGPSNSINMEILVMILGLSLIPMSLITMKRLRTNLRE